MLPNYIDEKLKAYFKMSSEDRRALLDERLFDDNPLTCNERYLPFFALEVGIDIDDLDVDKKREAIANAISEIKRGGTISYLKNNLKADIKNEVVELDNFHFRVDLMPEDANEKFDERRFINIKKRVERFKNVRSVFDGVRFKLFFDESVNVSGASVVKPKIDKDAKVEDAYIYNVYTNSASSFKTEINKEKNLEFSIENSINHYQFLTFNPMLRKEVAIEVTLNNMNKIQGAVLWQV